ncbi:hypothetical protein [Acinetobacter gerneri]|uniref:hypothetical protein n=1 Tax=Acinetobacter gerneri TaxID=202952 RepID=UPI003213AA71
MLVHILNRFLGSSNSDRFKADSEASYERSRANDFEQRAAQHLHDSHSSHFEDHETRNAMWYYLRAALRGDQEAQYKMGLSYLNGQLGLDRNYSQAEKWLVQAAHQGHLQAKEELNKAYNNLAFS